MNINNCADNIQNNVEAEEELGSLIEELGSIRFPKFVRSNQFNPAQIRSLTLGFRSDW